MALTFTTRFGTPLRQLPSFADSLEAGGLHRSDPRFAFALDAVKAAPAAKRAAVFERFAAPAPDVTLPPFAAFQESDFMPPREITVLAAFCGTLAQGSWDVALEVIRGWLNKPGRPVNVPVDVGTITLILRRFEAERIENLTHAWLLGVSADLVWRSASREWLTPYAETYLAEWLADKTDLADLADNVRGAFDDIPEWMSTRATDAV